MAFEFTAHELLFDVIEAERELVRAKNRWVEEARAISGVRTAREAPAVKLAAAVRLLRSPAGSRSRRRAGDAMLRVARLIRPWSAGGSA